MVIADGTDCDLTPGRIYWGDVSGQRSAVRCSAFALTGWKPLEGRVARPAGAAAIIGRVISYNSSLDVMAEVSTRRSAASKLRAALSAVARRWRRGVTNALRLAGGEKVEDEGDVRYLVFNGLVCITASRSGARRALGAWRGFALNRG